MLIVLTISGLFALGVFRLQFSTDMLASLPHNDPVLADARYILRHNPALEKIAIDINTAREDTALLSEAAAFVEKRLRTSGLFRRVGLEHMAKLMPGLVQYIAAGLPRLFTGQELAQTVAPLLEPEKVRAALAGHITGLSSLQGIGRAGLLARDPLGLSRLVLGRLALLIPAKNIRIEQGLLLSADRRHGLIIAEPAGAGTDTAFARRLTALLQQIDAEAHARFGDANPVTITPAGSYRTLLDNEENARRNVETAALFSTVAVVLLLIGAFPRPFIGLLALVPAVFGIMLAVFVYSLFRQSISLLAVGFGGAIVSFTVDYGIAFLLFLDREHATKGAEASHKVWSLGLIAMLTTAVSFTALTVSGFPALAEIGLFSALGVVFTYIFVHLIVPYVFADIPAASRRPAVPLYDFAGIIFSSHATWKAVAALVFCAAMLFFARPEFHIDPTALNASSPQTRAAEKLVQSVWGDMTGSMQLMLEADSLDELTRRGDHLSRLLQAEIESGTIQPCFLPSGLLPGPGQARKNSAAWRRFWSAGRIAALEEAVQSASAELGFAPHAFVPFFTLVRGTGAVESRLPGELRALFGITQDPVRGTWRQVLTMSPGTSPDPGALYRRLTARKIARLFDPGLFASRLGDVLLSGFLKMALIVGLVTVLVAFFYFLDWKLTLLGIAPTVFALVCTLGTLKLLNQPLGIPTLMVAVVIIGMGTDYALYLVRTCQRYCNEDNVPQGLIRLSVTLSFATTFCGFGVLALCDNPILKSAGLSLALGIGYSFIGAAAIVPPLLQRVYRTVPFTAEAVPAGSWRHLQTLLRRYRHLEAYTRFFALFKVLCDPMFPRIAGFFESPPRVIIDIGAGYGVPAVWLLALFPDLRIYGNEPDSRRLRCAAWAMGDRGSVLSGRAPDIPPVSEPADAALVVDMLHYIDDAAARLLLVRLRAALRPGALLIVRVTVPRYSRPPLLRLVEQARLKLFGVAAFFRTAEHIKALLTYAGFTLSFEEPSAAGGEVTWFIARS